MRKIASFKECALHIDTKNVIFMDRDVCEPICIDY